MATRILSRLALCAALAVAGSAAAQQYANFSIGAGFTPDPLRGTGQTGGSTEASSRFGGSCTGMIDRTPDHVITVTSALNLRMFTESSTDSTLVMRGPAGTFCDDDSHGNMDAEINARLTPGRYEVYVGHLGQTGNYTLTLTENTSGGGTSSGGGDLYANFTVGAGFTPDPQRGRGTTGGPRDASSMGKGCMGQIDSSPDHRLTVTSALDLKVYVESTTDSTLVITGPKGMVWCDDDSHGNADAEVNARFFPGEYAIYVGHLNSSGDYTITLTEN